jgi:hypothetical protein
MYALKVPHKRIITNIICVSVPYSGHTRPAAINGHFGVLKARF